MIEAPCPHGIDQSWKYDSEMDCATRLECLKCAAAAGSIQLYPAQAAWALLALGDKTREIVDDNHPEMISRIARAICREEALDGVHACPTDFSCSDCDYLRAAQAALRECREPTEAILDAFSSEVEKSYLGDGRYALTQDTVAAIWRAMINAALK